MDWEQLIYGLLIILVAFNAVAFYFENYTYVGINENNEAIPFRFAGYQQGNTFSESDLNSTLEDTRPEFGSLIEDTQPDNIWSVVSSGFQGFLDLLGQFYNVATGYQRIFNTLFLPLNTADAGTCITNPTNDGCVGTGIATIFITILYIPILIGVLLFIKLILQTVGIAR